MEDALRQTVERVNARLTALIEDARHALQGECEFNVESVRKLREPVEEMAPIVAQFHDLRRLQPEIAGQLDLYKSNLDDLQTTLRQIRVMLLTRQGSLNASQTHVTAVSRWVAAFRQTR
jgi:hypothetical protein